MPIYEYRCNQCEHDFELLVKSAKDSGRSTCPSCGNANLTRRLSVIAASSGSSSQGGAGAAPAGAGCGRCGDPNGPCEF